MGESGLWQVTQLMALSSSHVSTCRWVRRQVVSAVFKILEGEKKLLSLNQSNPVMGVRIHGYKITFINS